MAEKYTAGLCHGASTAAAVLLLVAGLRRLAAGPRADAIAEYSAGFHHGVDMAQKYLGCAS
jgi:hypothetical protein